MKIRQFKVLNRHYRFFFLIIITMMIAMMAGCSGDNINHTNALGDITSGTAENTATSPNNGDWMTLAQPVPLQDILDFNREDIQSFTIIKYQNNIKTGTATISDEKSISEVAGTLFDLSVMHTKEKPPANNIVYEIQFYQTKGPQKSLSISSMKNEKDFSVGGSFIDDNNLTPLQTLIQTNAQVSFTDIQIMLEALLTGDNHPTINNDTVTYSNHADGLVLEVTVPKNILYGQRFRCTAKITNTTDEVIRYYIPVYDENAHQQIQVKIGAGNHEFIDCDTFGKAYGTAMMALEIKAHDSFAEKIDFLPGYRTGGSWQDLNEADITFFQSGSHNGKAQFVWESGPATKDLSLDFTVTIE